METPRAVDKYLQEFAQTPGAKDLLITAGKSPQLRVNNEITSLNYPDLTAQDTRELCLSLLSDEQKQQFEKEKELDISISLKDHGRFRVNIYYQRSSVAMVIRIIAQKIMSLAELGVPPWIAKMGDMQRGLILFTGSTGMGKSTTMASIIDHINQTRSTHIVCIEDPIEYIHSHNKSTVDQREIGSDTHSFRDALRRVLRQSPDVIMIGEIRDRESAQAAITLAETGHLILATLHTRGAVPAVDRLVNLFPPEQYAQVRAQLAASLEGVVWQQLLTRKDKKGLVLACEIMVMTPAIRALIRKAATHELYSAIQTGKKYGMCTMEQAINNLVRRDLVDSEWVDNHFYANNAS